MTGVVARIVMDKWEKLMKESLAKNLVEIYLFGKYVDDVNLATSLIAKGYSWSDGPDRRLVWSEERYTRDVNREVSDSERTLELIREEASRLVKGLDFTADCQERNSDGKCPMLDLKV